MPVTGDDGVTPVFKIENDTWYVSYDKEATCKECGPATGAAGDSFFSDVSTSEDGRWVYLTLADGETMAPADVEPLTDDGLTVRVTLRQGVYHQIKRMFGVYAAGVNALHRESIGGVALDAALAPGQWRELTEEEEKKLRQKV